MTYDFITIGGSTEDITFYTKEGIFLNNKDIPGEKLWAFKYGTKIRINDAHCSFGGGAANAAVNFSNLGFKTSIITSIGNDDRAKKIIKNFKKHKVNTKFIQRVNTDTGFSFLVVGKNNEHIVFSDRASNNSLQITNTKILKKTDWIYLTSLSGKWENLLDRLFLLKNTKIAWNPGIIQINAGVNKIKKYLKNTKVLLVNYEEAIELIISIKKYKNIYKNNIKTKTIFKNIKKLLQILKEMGPEIIVITRGKLGANAYDGNNFFYQKKIKKGLKIDTTGVGDAFNSSFCAGLKIYDNDIKKALYLGAQNSASVLTKEGAQNGLLNKKQINL